MPSIHYRLDYVGWQPEITTDPEGTIQYAVSKGFHPEEARQAILTAMMPAMGFPSPALFPGLPARDRQNVISKGIGPALPSVSSPREGPSLFYGGPPLQQEDDRQAPALPFPIMAYPERQQRSPLNSFISFIAEEEQQAKRKRLAEERRQRELAEEERRRQEWEEDARRWQELMAAGERSLWR